MFTNLPLRKKLHIVLDNVKPMDSDIQQSTNYTWRSHNSFGPHSDHQHDKNAAILWAPLFPVTKAITYITIRSNTHDI